MTVSSEGVSPINSVPGEVQKARRGLLFFFALLIPLSAAVDGLILVTRNLSLWVWLLMWMPALSSIIARLCLREGFADVSFRLGGRSGLYALLRAWLVPLVIGLVAYGVAWVAGLATFHTAGSGPAILFVVEILLLMTMYTLISGVPSALGEEIGWRGYMLTRLIDAGIPRPVLVSGLIWGLWHLPLILGGVYLLGAIPALSAAIFMVTVISIGYISARLRLESGSIWPCVLLHAVWNVLIQSFFDAHTRGALAWLWTGEGGIVVALVTLACALLLSRGQWHMIRALPKRGEPVRQEIVTQP